MTISTWSGRSLMAVILAVTLAACGSVSSSPTGSGAGGRAGTTGGAGTTGVAGTTGDAGTIGSAGTTGGAGTTGAGGTAGGAGTTGAGGAGGGCPSGQVWCPGCTPGTGACSSGGCPGVACPPIDAGAVKCADVTTLEECDARTDCHSVFQDLQDCRCAAVGCCTRFLACADGDRAQCKATNVLCKIATPYCEGPYVVSYTAVCYEGCVRATECAP